MKTPSELQSELIRISGKKVLLFLNDNRCRMIAVRTVSPGLVEVRLQKMFLKAPQSVLEEIGCMIRGSQGTRTAIRDFVHSSAAAARSELPTQASASAPVDEPRSVAPERFAGRWHDLAAYAEHINSTCLGNRSKAPVMWGRRCRSRRRKGRSIRFGCYDPVNNRIIINRRLDSPKIPAFYVQYILFHEMLHEVLGTEALPDGRRSIHPPSFKLLESTFPDYFRARQFERELIKDLDII